MNDYSDEFDRANNQLGELINSGIFGKNVKELTNKFRDIPDIEYYSKCLDLWLNDEQYGKDKIKYYIKAFMEVFADSVQKDRQKTFYEITAFFKGDKSGYRTENITPYKEFLLNHKDCWNQIKNLSNQPSSKLIAIKESNLIINDYSKGVEFISKIYGLIVILFCIIDKRNINIKNINRKTLYEKCNDIKNRKNKDYDIFVNCIDRNIRNSQAHLNVTFNPNTSKYVFKILKKSKWINYEVGAKEMVFNIYSKVGWCIQGFIYAVSLIVIIGNDRNKGIEYMSKIFN